MTTTFAIAKGLCGFQSKHPREHNERVEFSHVVSFGEHQMGMLDEVIAAALGAKSQSAPNQASQRQAAQDQFSQIAAALSALLAPRPAAAQVQTGQQNPLGGLD